MPLSKIKTFQGQGVLNPTVTESPTELTSHNIVTVEIPKKQEIYDFNYEKLSDHKGLQYSSVSKRFDQTDRRSQRFKLSELTRGPLSVSVEEEKKINTEVERRYQEKLKNIREETLQKAYEEGFSDGKKDGQAEVQVKSQPLLDSFQKLILEFENLRESLFKANEEFLIHMVYRLTKAVILKEVKEDKEYLKRLIANILERMGIRENVHIYVGSAEFSTAQALKGDLAQILGELKNITIDVDNEIQTGGCRVETDFSEVDARLEVQIENIGKSLIG